MVGGLGDAWAAISGVLALRVSGDACRMRILLL